MEEKIKIAFFISNLGQGGAEYQFVQLIKGLNRTKFDVYVYLYAYQKEAFFKELFSFNDTKVFTNKLNNEKVIFKIFEALSYIRNVLSTQRFDCVYTSLFMNGFFVRLASPRSYRNRIIASVRSSIKNYHYYYKIFIYAEKLLIKNSFLVFNSVSALSEFKPIFKAKYHHRLSMIYNGFLFQDVSKNLERASSKITIGGMGRQSKEKNFLQIARVVPTINRNDHLCQEINLILQGEVGDQTVEIEDQRRKNSRNIQIREPNPKIDEFFSEIDIMVLPSLFEGCPNVLFESMIHRRICIISEGANSDDFVINGKNGLVYDGTDEGLLLSLNEALSIRGTKVSKEIVENAYQFVTQSFDMTTMVNNYEELFSRICEKNKSRY